MKTLLVDVWPGHHISGCFRYRTMQQKERRNKTENNKIHGLAKKGLASTGHANFTMRKKNIIRGDLTFNLHSSSQKVLPYKSSLSRKILLNP